MIDRVISGSSIVVGITIFQFIVLLAVQVALARVLDPQEFGIFALISLIGMFFNTLSNLQGDKYYIKEKNNNESLDTIFTTELLWSITLFCFCFFISPSLMIFLKKPDLTEFIQLFCIVLISNPFLRLRAIFEKKLSFARANVPMLISNIIGGGAAIALAMNDYGIWSLIWWKVITFGMEGVLIWTAVPFRPKLAINYKTLKSWVWFCYPLIVGSLLVYIYSNIDYYIIESILDMEALGYYWMAYQSSYYLFYIRVGVNKVIYPIMAKADGLQNRIDIFHDISTLTSIVYFVFVLFIMYFSEEIIILFYGEKWIRSSILLKIFSIVVLIKATASNIGPFLHIHNKTKVDLTLALINLILLPPAIYLFTVWYGTIGAAIVILIVGNFSIIYVYEVHIKRIMHKGFLQCFDKIFFVLGAALIILVIFSYLFKAEGGIFYKLISYAISIIILVVIYKKDISSIRKRMMKV